MHVADVLRLDDLQLPQGTARRVVQSDARARERWSARLRASRNIMMYLSKLLVAEAVIVATPCRDRNPLIRRANMSTPTLPNSAEHLDFLVCPLLARLLYLVGFRPTSLWPVAVITAHSIRKDRSILHDAASGRGPRTVASCRKIVATCYRKSDLPLCDSAVRNQMSNHC